MPLAVSLLKALSNFVPPLLVIFVLFKKHRIGFDPITITRKQNTPLNVNTIMRRLSRVDRFLPIFRLMFVFSVCRLISRRCHIISTIHPLAPAPHRTGLADFPHPALQAGSHTCGINPSVTLHYSGSCS